MGLDGGTIISRNDVLRGQCWDLNKADDSRSSRGGAVRGTLKRRKLDKPTDKVTRWTTCALSGQPLAPPVVACFLGRLYSKASVLEFLLAKKSGHFEGDEGLHRYLNILRQAGDDHDHLNSIKDVFPLAYTPPAPGAAGAAAVATDAAGASDPALPAPYECPITHLRCDKHAFVALRPCGHLFAERAVREAAGDGSCPTCGKPFLPEDAIPLLPSEERLEQLRDLLPTRRKQQQQGGERGKKRRQAEAATQQQQGGAAEQGAARAGAATAGSGQQQQQQSGD